MLVEYIRHPVCPPSFEIAAKIKPLACQLWCQGYHEASRCKVPIPNVIPRFVCAQHCPYLPGMFNYAPQSGRFGRTSAGAYVFLGNVVLSAQ